MIRERARAKVNLTLRVLGRRTDGYHEIDSLVSFAEDVCDYVTFVPGRPLKAALSGPFANRIVGTNILETALRRLAETNPDLTLGSVHIEKQLPVAAGIGGGSANAGALLRAVAAANPATAEKVDWMGLAASLGADVPACFADVACRATGLGEKLEALPELPVLDAVLVNPMAKVPPDKTAQIFRLLQAPAIASRAPHAPSRRIANATELVEVMSEIGNDLEPAARQAFHVIEQVLDALHGTEGCRYAAMSGAGPTCFGVFDDRAEAAATLKARHPGWWVQPTRL